MKKRQVAIGDVKLNSLAKKYIQQILTTNRLTYGPFTRKLEQLFARIHQRRWAIFTSSGTGALLVGLASLKECYHWRDGDEVLVPAISFVATANVVYHLRLKPVFVDVELATYNLDPKEIAKHISHKTRAIIPVHVLGLPANMPAIVKLAKKYKLKILEDSCDSMFVGIKQRPVGSWGDLAAFSTYVAHLLPTGVGGFLLGNDKKIESIARSYLFHGRNDRYLSINDENQKDKTVIRSRFQFDRIGWHFRLTELEAVIGLSQLETGVCQKQLKRRQQLANLLIKLLKPLENQLQLPVAPVGFEHAYMMFPLLIKDRKIDKWKLIYFLESSGIATRELLPLLNQPAYKKTFGNLEAKYPIARMINHQGFYFGCHPYMKTADIHYIAAKLYEFLQK